MAEYLVNRARIAAEVGGDVCTTSNERGKLRLLQEWLYGSGEPFPKCRIAPSIIARSEAELLAISSPRFAIRAYLNKHSFVNMRRRKVAATAIRRSYDSVSVGERLAADFERKTTNWIADSLLEPPPRLRARGFKFLTATLGRDYGERTVEAMTPFVTHISVGGGMCAQAACFMALLMSSAEKVYGIAEITKKAFGDHESFEMSGLKPRAIAKFFKLNELRTDAQLQQYAVIDRDAIARIGVALRAYLQAEIPVILLTSLARMFGAHQQCMQQRNPVIIPNDDEIDRDDYRKLPLPRSLEQHLRRLTTEQGDWHSVVVVGFSDNGFVINDPATYPFLVASLEQLVMIRPYMPQGKSVEERLLTEDDVGAFEFISVTPKGVRMPLLNTGIEPDFETSGLLKAASEEHHFGDQAGLTYPQDTYDYGRLYLGAVHERKFEFVGTEFPKLDQETLSHLQEAFLGPRWYWVQHLPYGDQQGKTLESMWFWDASREWNEVIGSLSAVVVRDAASKQWKVLDPLEQ